MTSTHLNRTTRPLAVALAFVFTAACWLPTVSDPASAAARKAFPTRLEQAGQAQITLVIDAPLRPALM